MYYKVSSIDFISALNVAQQESELVRNSTSTLTEIHKAAKFYDCYYLHHDKRSGFIITGDGELKGVFSLERGRGSILVQSAIKRGAMHLDCFDGYLVKLYQKHGFGSWKIEPNWTPGGPSVHYMRLGHPGVYELDEATRMLGIIYGN